jgi:outer membrane receptor protein involved in Fe transport
MTRSRRRKLQRIQATGRHPAIRKAIPVASLLLASMHGAYAEEATENAGLAEVVVTAEKRTENLQNVPVSIQVLDNKRLEELKVGGLDDYVKYSPSVAFSRGDGQGSNGGPGNSHVYMRGVVSGVNENHSGSQPSVGTYLDEQPVTTIDGTPDMRIYDVERIEVLEGPQGTLYGASSEAGTIRIITNKPDPTKFAAGFDLDGNKIQHGGFGYATEGFVNIPITDFAAVRLVGWIEHTGGFIDNVAGTNASACIVNGVRTFPTWDGQPHLGPQTPCPAPGVIGAGAIDNSRYLHNNYNTADTRGGRATGRISIGDNWTVTPSIIAQSTSTEGFFGYDPVVGDLKVTHFGPENSHDNWQQSALTVEGKLSNWDLVYAGGYMKRTSHGIADYSDYSLFYDRVLGYGSYWVGNDGNPIMPQQLVNNGGYFEKWSNELRITSPADLPVKGTAGLFIQRQLHNIWQQYIMPGYGFINPYGNNPTNNYGVNPNGLATDLSIPQFDNTIWLTDEQRVDRDKAVFAQLTWDITSQLSVTGGFRYYKFDNSLQGFYGLSTVYGEGSSGVGQCFGPPVTHFAPCENLNKDVSDTGWVPKANVTYKITPDHMVYATYSKGFRPGGVNRNSKATIQPYQTDYLKNYEIGWKTQWLDHSLRWNGALFWEDWNNFQYSFLGPNSVTVIENGGNARIKGIETELQWAATNNLMLTGNLTLLDAKLTQQLCPTVGESPAACAAETTDAPFLPGGVWTGAWAPAGTRLPVAPRFKGNVVARYTFSRVNGWEPFAQASFIYQTQTSQSLRVDQSLVVGNIPAYGLLDLIGGVNIDTVTAQAYVTNATDRRAQLSRFAETTASHDNQIYAIPTQPRTFGIKFSMRF